MKLDKDTKELYDYAVSQGFVLVRSKKHLVLRRKSRTVIISRTPSCPRNIDNTRQYIDRAVREEP